MAADLSWLSALRDIHPGTLPDTEQSRLWALSLLLLLLPALLLLVFALRQLWRRQRWWQQHGKDELPALHHALRRLTRHRWPELSRQPTRPWLATLDERSGTHLHQWQEEWESWVYGRHPLSLLQRKRLDAEIKRLLAACYPLLPRRRP
ncbi:hypothetical protein [Aeromonas schubertii]|uniref:hypothetical protein n=1 Tax=Aeromonas schubertii TaxID=652 RepID=UPI001CC64265|nr:hypothetical protein [Aeromonas schubertii]MBZ6074444.1 hypothetical protein [Aeromonas schubertii]